ncbi:RecQ family ATP-dependent DNA helicase [Actinokineospora sp. NPDC004072]
MTQSDRLRRLAAETFGWPRLHPEQLAAMEHIMAGRDVLAVLPTGAGKSAIYQVPALLLDGPTVVVSPLIALQQDQQEGIEGSRAPDAVVLNSAQSEAENRAAWAALGDGTAEYVFLSPEQLAKDELVDALAELGVSLFVVDEAHCVSTWGHDFRPDYLRLGPVLQRLGHPRAVALTATAAPPVRQDIARRLGLRDHREVMASFDRPNLHLAVDRFTSDDRKRAAVVDAVRERSGVGLLYAATRKDTEYYAGELAAAGVRVAHYHAGMAAGDRERVHEDFLSGAVDVVVATSAFGMGIDKPDVRFVVHASVPDSLDSYYQQIGRAGRDGEPADAVLCYRSEDLGLQRFLTASGTPEDTIGEVARVLDAHDEPLAPGEVRAAVDAAPGRTTRAMNLLEEAGAVTADAEGRLRPTDAPDPVDRAVETAEARERLVRTRVEMVRAYAETTGCRRIRLLAYFGEDLPDPCGNCDNCDAGTARPTGPASAEFPLNASVRHSKWGHGVVTESSQDRITVLFDDAGYRTLSVDAVADLLTRE